MQENNQLNQRAVDVLCNEIMKVIEVKTKRIVADALKGNTKPSDSVANKPVSISSPYPVGSYCILQNGLNPTDFWTGVWERIDGDIYVVESQNAEEIQWASPGAVIWKRVR